MGRYNRPAPLTQSLPTGNQQLTITPARRSVWWPPEPGEGIAGYHIKGYCGHIGGAVPTDHPRSNTMNSITTRRESDTTIYACPAFDVVARDPAPAYRGGVLELRHGDQVALMGRVHRGQPLPHLYTVGTAVSYALQYGEDPIAAHARCVERGEATHWLNEQAASISNMRQERKVYINVDLGQVVAVEGKFFVVELVRKGGPWLKLVPTDRPSL